MNFTYYMPTRILFGAGQLNRLHEQKLPGRKALIVVSAGKSVRANGYLARVEKELDLAGAERVVFDKIVANPIKKHVMQGAALARELGCDFVVGLGGGSSIDAAKAIAVMARNDGDYWDYVSGGT
ncbi:iron-containing alcohol dehydrogenase, partial [bacterium]|nr:iron-containing alcohol dehydrogenase [bacterium]